MDSRGQGDLCRCAPDSPNRLGSSRVSQSAASSTSSRSPRPGGGVAMSQEPATPPIAIEKKPPESPVHDVMGGASRWEVKVHDHGLVALLDVLPRFAPLGKTAEFAIVQAARVIFFFKQKTAY